jgi:riboflavin kinase/FMN adenylyltransferase
MVSCGENFRFGKGAAGDTAALRHLCGDSPAVEVLPLVILDGAPISSSQIRAAIRAGEMERANRLLGRRFTIDFEVVHGRQLGRTLGTPTINQPFPEGFVEPKFGVYATLATAQGREYAAVTNVGVKPTVGSDRVLAETYIHGFSGDLYGQSVRVSFLRFLRPERKFEGIEALREQIVRDSEIAARTAAEAGFVWD